jgi:copper transport protein
MPTPRRRSALVSAVTLAVLLLFPTTSWGHAGSTATSPVDASQLDSAPTEISVTLTEPITLSADPLKLIDSSGASVALSTPVTTPEGNGTVLSASPVTELADGWYAVVWRVVSADGHPKTGSFTFRVGTANAEAGAIEVDDPTAPFRTATTPLRFLGYLTALLAIGLLFASWPLAVVPAAAARAQRWAGYAAVGGLITAPVTLFNFTMLLNGGQLDGLGSVFMIALQSSTGTAQLVRTSALFALCTAVLLASEKSLRVVAVAAAAIGAVALTFSYSMTGHASVVPLEWLAAPALVLHLLAASAWVGGLPAVAWAFSKRRDFDGAQLATLVSRFSTLATVSVITVAVAGTALSITMFTKPGDVFSRYGYSLLAKLAVVAVVAAAGAYNHYVAAPRMRAAHPADGEPTEDAPAARASLARTLRLEAFAVVAVAIATTVLTSSGAPAAGGSHGADGHGHRGDTGRLTAVLEDNAPAVAQAPLGDGGVELSVLPARAGAEMRITVRITDALGAVRTADSVNVAFTHPASGIGPLERSLTRVGDIFELTTTDLGVAGTWTVEITAKVGALSSSSTTVDVNIAPAAPAVNKTP